MYLQKIILYVKLLFSNKFWFLSQVLSRMLLSFPLVLLIKDLLIKKSVNYNLIADQSSFLASKTTRLVLGLYV